MKSDKLAMTRDLPITPVHWDTPVSLQARSYGDFCRRMDEALRQLVARWEHRAAPNASRQRQRVS